MLDTISVSSFLHFKGLSTDAIAISSDLVVGRYDGLIMQLTRTSETKKQEISIL